MAGNDFDIQLALQGIMPSLGMNSELKTGKPMAKSQFYQALAINNIIAQTDFYSRKNRRELAQLSQDAQETNNEIICIFFPIANTFDYRQKNQHLLFT